MDEEGTEVETYFGFLFTNSFGLKSNRLVMSNLIVVTASTSCITRVSNQRPTSRALVPGFVHGNDRAVMEQWVSVLACLLTLPRGTRTLRYVRISCQSLGNSGTCHVQRPQVKEGFFQNTASRKPFSLSLRYVTFKLS